MKPHETTQNWCASVGQAMKSVDCNCHVHHPPDQAVIIKFNEIIPDTHCTQIGEQLKRLRKSHRKALGKFEQPV